MHVFFRLQGGIWILPALTPKSDGLTVAIVPQSSSVKCHSRKRDTAQFHLVEFDDHMCIDWPEYSPDGRLFACWSDTGSLVRVWDTQTSQLVGKFPTFSVCAIALSPTLIQHSPGDRLIALWHRFGNTIRLFGTYAGHLCASILGRAIHMAILRDGTKLAYCAPDLGLRIMGHSGSHGWGLAFRPCYELWLQGMADGWVVGRDNGLLFWVSVEHRNILYVQPLQSGNRSIPKEGNERGPIQLRVWQKGMHWQRAVERVKGEGRGVAGVGNQSASCPQLKYLEVLRWSGELERRTSELVGLLEFLFVLASQVCLNDLFWKCIRRSSYTDTEEKQWSIPDDIIYELFILSITTQKLLLLA